MVGEMNNTHALETDTTHTPAAYLGIANSLALVATFAGGFTYGNVITLQINRTTCNAEKIDDISTLLSIAFILFTISLFVTIFIQVFLRGYKLNVRMPDGCITAHTGVQLLFLASAILLTAGFVFLHIVLMHSGQRPIGIIGIALIGTLGTVAGFWGWCH